jgi:hypothetical protein
MTHLARDMPITSMHVGPMHLTSDMRKLRRGILKGHAMREKLVQDLHAQTVHKLNRLQKEIQHNAQNAAARRRVFVLDLERKVGRFLDDVALELASARRAWCGIENQDILIRHANGKVNANPKTRVKTTIKAHDKITTEK